MLASGIMAPMGSMGMEPGMHDHMMMGMAPGPSMGMSKVRISSAHICLAEYQAHVLMQQSSCWSFKSHVFLLHLRTTRPAGGTCKVTIDFACPDKFAAGLMDLGQCKHYTLLL